MDKASRALAQPVPLSLSDSYRARADRSGVPHTTLHHRARGRRSIEEKAQSQQYLAPYEEDALVHFLLQLSDLGQPVRIKYIRFLALCVTRQRLETDRPLKPPGKNWTRGFENIKEKMNRRDRAIRAVSLYCGIEEGGMNPIRIGRRSRNTTHPLRASWDTMKRH
jgi:hypothetical protein